MIFCMIHSFVYFMVWLRAITMDVKGGAVGPSYVRL